MKDTQKGCKCENLFVKKSVTVLFACFDVQFLKCKKVQGGHKKVEHRELSVLQQLSKPANLLWY